MTNKLSTSISVKIKIREISWQQNDHFTRKGEDGNFILVLDFDGKQIASPLNKKLAIWAKFKNFNSFQFSGTRGQRRSIRFRLREQVFDGDGAAHQRWQTAHTRDGQLECPALRDLGHRHAEVTREHATEPFDADASAPIDRVLQAARLDLVQQQVLRADKRRTLNRASDKFKNQ